MRKATKIMKYMLIGSIVVCFIIGNGSCRGSGSKPIIDTSEIINPIITPESVIPQDTEISSFSIYYDNSASMAGYVAKSVSDNTFRNLINAFAQDFIPGIPFSARLCCKGKDGKEPLSNIDFETFSKMIADGKVPQGSESLLNVIMNQIVTNRKPGELCAFITDGIISGPQQEINKDLEYTPKNISTLESNLRNQLSGRGLAASIYEFPAQYHGTYWNYSNNKKGKKITLNGQRTRPLYCVVIGSPEIISQFKRLVESSNFKNFPANYNVAHSIEKLPITSGIYIPQHGGAVLNGSIVKYDRQIAKKNNSSIMLTLSTDILKDVFNSNMDWSNLASKLKVEINGIEGDYERNYSDGSLRIVVPVDHLSAKGDVIKVSIPYSRPEWISLFSTSDDVNNYSDGTTFMLDRFAGAILNGVNGSTTDPDMLFEESFTLKRK